mmetsp:Transcript_26977/g.82802  ORF Transcript_26977/g.82802 Transcript_26977/m.82802 type:complete len:199 (-) Transcript_26977:78-674(-)
MRRGVLAVAVSVVVAFVEGFLPATAVRGKWRLSAISELTKVKSPEEEKPGAKSPDGGNSGGGRAVPTGGRGGDDGGQDGDAEKKQVAPVGWEAKARMFGEQLPSGDLIALFGIIMATFFFTLAKIDTKTDGINAKIDSTSAELRTTINSTSDTNNAKIDATNAAVAKINTDFRVFASSSNIYYAGFAFALGYLVFFKK